MKRLMLVLLLFLLIPLLALVCLPQSSFAADFPAAPTHFNATSLDYDTMSLSWDAVAGADGYQLQYYLGSLTWWTIGHYSGTSCTVVNFATGLLYQFRIRAYQDFLGGTIYGDWAYTDGVALFHKPSNLSVNPYNYNSLSLTWDPVNGAEGYVVQLAQTAAGPWETLTSSITTPSYISSGLITGTQYVYRVQAWRYEPINEQTTYGEFSDAISGTPMPSTPGGLGIISTGYQSLQLTWNPTAGASGYEIRRKISADLIWTVLPVAVPSTYYDDSGLFTGTEYAYQVRAYRLVNKVKYYSDWTATKTGIPVPSRPTGLKATSISYNTLQMTWSAVVGADGYELQRGTSSTGPWTTIANNLTVLSYIDTGLIPGKTNYYQVRAYTTNVKTLVFGPYSAPASGVSLPSAPDKTTIQSINYQTLRISWPAVAGANGYQVQRATLASGPWTTIVSHSTNLSLDDAALICGTPYYYQVRAYAIVSKTTYVYGAWSPVGSGQPIPTKPANLQARSSSYCAIALNWNSVDGATRYQVQHAYLSNGHWSDLHAALLDCTYSDTGLETGKTMFYRVRAYRTADARTTYGEWSSVVPATPVPATPGGLTATSGGYNSIQLKWTAVDGATGYDVWRKLWSTGTFTLIATQAETSLVSTGLSTNKTYYFKVRAYRLVGTNKIYSGESIIVSATPIPSIPTGVKAVSAGYNCIKVSWTAVAGASGYEVWRKLWSTGTFALVTTQSATNLTNSGLSTNKTYYYKVRAYRLVGTTKVFGKDSVIVNATPIPSTPTGLKASYGGSKTVNLTWTSVLGATGYEVYRKLWSTGTYGLIAQPTAASLINSGLAVGKTYYYKVRAYRLVGTTKVYSQYSTVVSFTPAS